LRPCALTATRGIQKGPEPKCYFIASRIPPGRVVCVGYLAPRKLKKSAGPIFWTMSIKHCMRGSVWQALRPQQPSCVCCVACVWWGHVGPLSRAYCAHVEPLKKKVSDHVTLFLDLIGDNCGPTLPDMALHNPKKVNQFILTKGRHPCLAILANCGPSWGSSWIPFSANKSKNTCFVGFLGPQHNLRTLLNKTL
jgi:hypothetical protein